MLNLFWMLMFSWFTCTSMMLGTEVCRSCASQKRTLSQCISESLADVGFQRSGPLFTLTFGTSPRCVGMQIGNCYCWGRRWLCLSCGHIMGQIKYRRNVPGILNATCKFMQVWTVVFFLWICHDIPFWWQSAGCLAFFVWHLFLLLQYQDFSGNPLVCSKRKTCAKPMVQL